MLTPAEKLVFNTLLLSFLSMLVVAAYVYLPDHIAAICSHIYYYWAGDGSHIADYMPSANAALRDSTIDLNTLSETAKGPTTTVLRKMAEL